MHEQQSGCPVSRNTVSLVQKNQKIEPLMNRMDADGQRENPIVICVLHLRPSGAPGQDWLLY